VKCEGCNKKSKIIRCSKCSELIDRAKEMIINNYKVAGIFSLSDIPDRCRNIAVKEAKEEIENDSKDDR